MAIRLGDALLMLGADDDKLKKDLNDAERTTKGWSSALTGAVAGVAAAATNALLNVAQGAVQGIGTAIGDAVDLQETISKVNTIFGDSATTISDWARGAAFDLGTTRAEALAMAGDLGNMFVQLGNSTSDAAAFSQQMVGLATDLTSFHNVAGGTPEVLDAMTSAFRGEYDAVQRYIPTINAAAVEQQALADTGKAAAAELTAAEKAAAAMKLMLDGAGPAVGDFERTSGGLANTWRSIQAAWEDAKTEAATALLPALQPLATFVKDMAETYGPKFSEWITDEAIPHMEEWAAQFDNWQTEHGDQFIEDVLGTTTAIGEAWDTYSEERRKSWEEDSNIFSNSMNRQAELGGRIVGLIWTQVEPHWNEFKLWFRNDWNAFWQSLNPWDQALPYGGQGSGGGGGGFGGGGAPAIPPLAPGMAVPQSVTINNYVDAQSRTVGEAARDGTLDGLRQAGMR